MTKPYTKVTEMSRVQKDVANKIHDDIDNVFSNALTTWGELIDQDADTNMQAPFTIFQMASAACMLKLDELYETFEKRDMLREMEVLDHLGECVINHVKSISTKERKKP